MTNRLGMYYYIVGFGLFLVLTVMRAVVEHLANLHASFLFLMIYTFLAVFVSSSIAIRVDRKIAQRRNSSFSGIAALRARRP